MAHRRPPWNFRQAGIGRKTRRSRPAPFVRCGSAMLRSVLVDQAAELLGVSRRTVYYRIREGRLTTFQTKCGSRRVMMESIEALLREEAGVTATAAAASDTDPSERCP